MQYTRLGQTGTTVSRICLGCMSYGSPQWRPWVLNEDAARPFFRQALDHGINFFDTADMYSLGVSEEITGRALRATARLEEVVIASKVFWPMGDAPNMRGLSRKHVMQACEASLRRLGVETIDLYQIHRYDPDTPIAETLRALDDLVRQGKVRYIGASSGYAWQMMKALSVSERHGWARFVTMQNHYNLLYREEEREMLPLCRSEGIGVVPWSPLARGYLAGNRKRSEPATARSRADVHAANYYKAEEDVAVIGAVQEVAQRLGQPMAQVAYAWVASRPGITSPIVGLSKLEQFDDAVAALDLTLTSEDVALIESPYKPKPVIGHV